jgi:hypothetical protein
MTRSDLIDLAVREAMENAPFTKSGAVRLGWLYAEWISLFVRYRWPRLLSSHPITEMENR